MATLAVPTLPPVPPLPSLSSMVDAVLSVPKQVVDAAFGPSWLERFDADIEEVWEPFLVDD